MFGAPELDTALHEGLTRADRGENHPSCPAGHTALDAAQDMVGFLSTILGCSTAQWIVLSKVFMIVSIISPQIYILVFIILSNSSPSSLSLAFFV